MVETGLKLNLGCGQNFVDDYLNVDKFGEPQLRHDLEVFPWPWDDSSVSEILLNHVLEHLGRDTEIYFGIIKEIYRVMVPDGKVIIVVPHPRHDDFINDPTHVRMITPEHMTLFSKTKNREWAEGGHANSPLGLFIDVDFEIVNRSITPAPDYEEMLKNNVISKDQFLSDAKKYNNVIKQYSIELCVVK
jgi:hypothetical protein